MRVAPLAAMARPTAPVPQNPSTNERGAPTLL
jgi:hypothetical protein